MYSGEMQNNVPHGRGTVKYKQPNEWKRLSYEGDFFDGKASGSGTIQFVDGGSYMGQMKDDKQHGKGYRKYAQPNEWQCISYEGDWVNGKQEGFGTLLWSDQNKKYVGHFINGKQDGQGTFTWTIAEANGDGYSATICHNQHEKTGIFKNDDFWEGESKKNGKVIFQYKNGEIKENCIIS